MMHTLELVRRAARFRTIVAVSALAFLAGACNDADNLASSPIVQADLDSAETDSLAADSLAADSLAADSLALLDSLALTDSLAPVDTVEIAAAAARRSGVPFGPFAFWATYDKVKISPVPFSSNFNSISPDGIIKRINAARAKNQRIFLFMTPGHRDYMTRGRFDFAKWKRRMDGYNRPLIRAIVAAGLRDGTILGNAMLDEPNTRKWGSTMNKAMLDRMCSYAKRIFPGLPTGAVVVHWWRPAERYKTCDFIIDQWTWWQGPNGPGAGAYTGNVVAWREAALSQARKDGVAIAFSLNLLDGGIQNWRTRACPLGKTGGRGTVSIACRMTANQVRQWGLALGPHGCALLMWRHDKAFMSKSANVRAIKDVAGRMAGSSNRSCRRPG